MWHLPAQTQLHHNHTSKGQTSPLLRVCGLTSTVSPSLGLEDERVQEQAGEVHLDSPRQEHLAKDVLA